MNRTLPALTAMLVLAAGSAAHAQTPPAEGLPLVDAFKSLCVATVADKSAALAAADAAGWGPIPEAFLSQAAGVMQEATGRLKVDGSGFQVLVLGEQSQAMGAQTLRIKACAVVGAAPDPAAAEAAAAAFAGVTKSTIQVGEGASLWAFTEGASGHTLLDPENKPGVAAAVSAGTARLVFLRPLAAAGAPPGLTLLGYGVPKP